MPPLSSSLPPLLLTLSPYAGLEVATSAALPGAAGLLVPHDGQPVADVRGLPGRWADLQRLTAALRRGVPVLAWGSGAALAGRALGAKVHAGTPDWAELPREAAAYHWEGQKPLHWACQRVSAWAAPDLPPDLYSSFLSSLPDLTSRTPGSPLEAIGGAAVLRPLLADFYAQARADMLLGPMFEAHIDDWDAHLERVTAFWITMLGGEPGLPPWRGNLMTLHAGLGLRGEHLWRWLELFEAAAQRHLSPAQAGLLLTRAHRIGERLAKAERPAPSDLATSGN